MILSKGSYELFGVSVRAAKRFFALLQPILSRRRTIRLTSDLPDHLQRDIGLIDGRRDRNRGP